MTMVDLKVGDAVVLDRDLAKVIEVDGKGHAMVEFAPNKKYVRENERINLNEWEKVSPDAIPTRRNTL